MVSKESLSFFKTVHRTFKKHNGFVYSKALAFQTVFCLIPAVVLAFFVAIHFNLLEFATATAQRVLSQIMPNDIGKMAFSHLESSISHEKKPIYFAMTILAISAFSLVSNIHKVCYQFAEHGSHPSIRTQLFVYLLFVGGTLASVFLSGMLLNVFSENGHSKILTKISLHFANLAILSLNSYMLYYFISPVKFKKTATAIVSVLSYCVYLFAQKLSFWYFSLFPAYAIVYGAIVFLPILFFLIYSYWVIFLYGYSSLLAIHHYDSD